MRQSATIVAIGASTGGPAVLGEVLAMLPADLAAPVLVTLHLHRGFEKFLVERMRTKSALPVMIAQRGMVAEPGTAYFAPSDRHLVVTDESRALVLQLSAASPVNSCRPAVDVMLDSVARIRRKRAVAVILTGLGQDGLDGCRAIAAAGGRVIVQDRASSVAWGMPGAVDRGGLADAVLPPAGIAHEIVRCGGRAGRKRKTI